MSDDSTPKPSPARVADLRERMVNAAFDFANLVASDVQDDALVAAKLQAFIDSRDLFNAAWDEANR